MELFATKVRERAAELGLSQAEVARRAGITERRFGHYMSGRSEPDLQLLVRIAAVLATTPNHLLGVEPKAASKKSDEASRMRTRIAVACASMDEAALPLALTLVEAVLEHGSRR
jgi:transcriptional regulator with XRE-family HTH domain